MSRMTDMGTGSGIPVRWPETNAPRGWVFGVCPRFSGGVRRRVSATLSLAMALSLLLLGTPTAAEEIPHEKLQSVLEEGLVTRMVLIVDTSGSMNKPPRRGETKRKVTIARKALARFFEGLPEGIEVGVIVYDRCEAKWHLPLGPIDKPKLLESTSSLRAYGKTPIAASLNLAAAKLIPTMKTHPYSRNVVVLVTDGEETCVSKRDLAVSARNITDAMMELTVIGFDLPGQDSLMKKLATQYYRAEDSEQLSQGLASIQAELEVPSTVDVLPDTR